MKSLFLTFLCVFSFAQISCGQHQNHKEHTNKKTETEPTNKKDFGKVNSDVKKQLNALLLGYFEVKTALVATDSKSANDKAGELVKILAKVETAKMATEQQNFYKPLAEKIKFDAEHINQTQEVAHQRTHFEGLSNNLFQIIKSFKANKNTLYQQFCPMAFDDKGASWLSDKAEIRNPYFGDKMLKCGKVVEKL